MPDSINKIYNIGPGVMIVPDDPNITNKSWKKIQTYIDKFWPDFSDNTHEHLEKVHEFKGRSDLNHIQFATSFIYKPSDAIMQLLILKCAFL